MRHMALVPAPFDDSAFPTADAQTRSKFDPRGLEIHGALQDGLSTSDSYQQCNSSQGCPCESGPACGLRPGDSLHGQSRPWPRLRCDVFVVFLFLAMVQMYISAKIFALHRTDNRLCQCFLLLWSAWLLSWSLIAWRCWLARFVGQVSRCALCFCFSHIFESYCAGGWKHPLFCKSSGILRGSTTEA